MAKIFVVGGSGRVASELIKNLINDGNQVFASSRHPEKIIKLDNVVPVKLDLHSDVSAWSEVFKGMDVIYFVAGSRGKDLLQTDAMGAVKTMQAAENVGVKRYIMLSSLYVLTQTFSAACIGLTAPIASVWSQSLPLAPATK